MLLLFLIPDDDAVMSRLFLENYHRLRRTALGILKEPAAAEDAVQDALVRCIKRVDTLKALSAPAQIAYLLTAVKHCALNASRKNGAAVPVPVEELDAADESTSVEEAAIRNLTVQEVKDAFSKLPESLKDVLRYKYLLELSDGEIAKMLGVSKSTVRVYLMRARRAVLNLCREGGYAKERV